MKAQGVNRGKIVFPPFVFIFLTKAGGEGICVIGKQGVPTTAKNNNNNYFCRGVNFPAWKASRAVSLAPNVPVKCSKASLTAAGCVFYHQACSI